MIMFGIWTTTWNLMTVPRFQTEAARKIHWYIQLSNFFEEAFHN